MPSVYIAGVGMTPFGKRREPLGALIARAARQALRDAKLETVDALFVGVMNPEEFVGTGNTASVIADRLGLAGVPAIRVETASSTGAAVLHTGCAAIASGFYRRVLLVAGEKMTHLTTARVTRILAEMLDREERACGATMPALAAMITERYIREHRISLSHIQRIMAQVAIKNHYNGSLNPLAQFRQPITEAEYYASKLVSVPLRLYDCAPITDGAAAVVLTGEVTDIRIAGIGQSTDLLPLRLRSSLAAFRATRLAARRAYEMAGIHPEEIGFAEVHDAFTPFEIIATEDLGFFEPGKGGRAVEKGVTALDGPLPINPSGGLKARGHPVGATGLAQVVEVVYQMRGQVEPRRQVRSPALALAHSVGGLGTNNFVTILERADRARPLIAVRSPERLQPERPPHRPRPIQGVAPEGVIETFTIVHVPPEGFTPPLPLAIVRDARGEMVIARGEGLRYLKIGRRVFIERREGGFWFFPATVFEMARRRVQQLFRGRGRRG